MSLSPHLAVLGLVNSQANKEVTINDAIRALDRRNAYLPKAIVAGTNFLTPDEARFGVIELTGTLTAAAEVVIPDAFVCNNVFYNNTTGAFTVTIRYGTSGPTIVIPRGIFSPIRYDSAGAQVIYDRGRNANPYLPEFIVGRTTSNQNLPVATDTVIQFNNETLDNTSSFDSATNYRFTAPAPGLYDFVAQAEIHVTTAGTGNTNASIALRKNGSVFQRGDLIQGPVATTAVQRVGVRGLMILATNDTIDVIARQEQATSVSHINSGTERTYFFGRAIRLG